MFISKTRYRIPGFMKIRLSLCILLLCSNIQAQMNINGNLLYGNEWIDYSQSYYKMYVEEDGVYRITQQTLIDAGVPLSNINSSDFQLFAMGTEIPIYIEGNGTLVNGDYIEFFAKKNRGEVDKHLYSTPAEQFNPYHSMHTDTLAYFLTWSSATNRRLETTLNNLTNLPPAETHFTYDSYMVRGNKYNKGQPFSSLYEATFSPGEGFGGNASVSATYQVDTDNAYPAGGAAQFWIRFASEGDGASHNITLSVNNQALTIDSSTYIDYAFRQISQPLATNALPATTSVQLTGSAGIRDKHAVSFIKIRYPREFKFGNESTYAFKLDGEAGVRKYLEITDFNHNGIAPILYDLTNGLRLTTELNGGLIQVVLPASSMERELVLVNPNVVTNLDEIFPINFTNFNTTQSDYLILSHPKFINDPAGLVQAYANYRATTGFSPLVINLEELYDQFAYGVNKHPQAIRNFTGFSLENWTMQPEYMFMIGKSRPHFSIRTNPFNQPSYTPTFGHQASDNLLTATTTSDIPRISFGKIPVVSSAEIDIYLRKIMAYEAAPQILAQTIEEKRRLKRVLHLGGGDELIQEVIRLNFDDYKNVIEGAQVGADVTSFFKENNEAMQTSVSLTMDSLINEGVNLVTFYGHSSPIALDFNIDNPSTYENEGKYFTMFSMGCYGGQIHQKNRNISEEFVFAEDKGAVAFIATVGLSGLGSLDKFADSFYDQMANDSYGAGLGDIIKAVIADITTNNSTVANRKVYQEMTLNGDPALKINFDTAPDYIVNEPTIDFAPENLTNRDDIDLSFTVTNIGKAIDTQFKIKIDQMLPGGTSIPLVQEIVDAPVFEEEYVFTIPAIAAGGLQQFRITVDADNEIVELPASAAEDNNTVLTEVFILTNVVSPITPYDFAIRGNASDIVLQASIDPDFSDELNYYIEIDTTELFDSPLKQNAVITQSGGLIEWQPGLTYMDSTVYYWRVQVEQGLISNEPGWRNSSFIFLDESYPGWNQSHFYQFQKDEFIDLDYDESRRFEFINNLTEINAKVAHYPVLPSNQIDYSVNGSRIYDVENCELGQQGIYVALFDEDFSPFSNYQLNAATNEGQYDSWICQSQAPVFLFPTSDNTGQGKLEDFLNNDLSNIQDARYALIYSLNDYVPDTWNSTLFTAFANHGTTALENTMTLGGVPYAALLNLTTGSAEEVLGESLTDIIEAIFLIEGSWDNGKIRSTPIDLGTSTQWGALHWRVSEQEADDEAYVNVYGLTESNAEVLLLTGISTENYYFEATEIDPVLYPRIRLECVFSDMLNETAPQLDYWRVLDFVDTDNDLVQDLVDDCPTEPGIPENNGCPCIKLSLKVFLEGPFDATTGEMNTTLGSERRLLPGQTPIGTGATPTPAGQPYSLAPWNYTGTEGLGFSNANYNDDVVDWILVSVRTGIEKEDEIGRVAALLMKDGAISTLSQCAIETDVTDSLYVVLEHRNHLGIMSAEFTSLVNSELSYDFTIQNSYVGTTGTGQKEMTPGIWTMCAGDISQATETVSYDINSIDRVFWGYDGGVFDIYIPSDVNLDGTVDGEDKILWELNNGFSSRVPK